MFASVTSFLPGLPLLAALLSFVLGVIAWRKRTVKGAIAYLFLAIGSGIWLFSSSMHLFGHSFAFKNFWSKTQYFGIVLLVLAWCVFTLRFTNNDHWLKKRWVQLLGLPPALVLLTVWTNDYHLMFWKTSVIKPFAPGVTTISRSYGAIFWLYTSYIYVLINIAVWFLFQHFRKMQGVYKRQVGILLFAALFPLIGNVMHLSKINPLKPLDLTPFAFFLSLCAWAWGLFRYKLMDLLPIAREMVIDRMNDGVFILNPSDRIVDLNPQACRILKESREAFLGKTIQELLPALQDKEVAKEQGLELEILLGGGSFPVALELRTSPLDDPSQVRLGTLVLLHDISERKRAEKFRRLRQEAAAREKAQSAFLNRMSHELRTPLNAILGYTDLLIEDAKADKLETYEKDLERIQSAGVRLLGLVEDVFNGHGVSF